MTMSCRETDGPPDGARPLRVLLVDDGAHRVGLIRDELVRQGHAVVDVLESAPALHDRVARLRPDVVIVDSESPSRDTLEHLATLSDRNPRPVVVFAEDDADDPMQQAVAAGVSAYVVAGLQPQRLAPVLRVAIARFRRARQLQAELDEAREALSTRKYVERAKGILMRASGVNEDEAYARLRRLAMNRRVSLEQVARQVIDADSLISGPAD